MDEGYLWPRQMLSVSEIVSISSSNQRGRRGLKAEEVWKCAPEVSPICEVSPIREVFPKRKDFPPLAGD